MALIRRLLSSLSKVRLDGRDLPSILKLLVATIVVHGMLMRRHSWGLGIGRLRKGA
jgi:hypothetical protein